MGSPVFPTGLGYFMQLAYSVLPFSLFVFIDWKSKKSFPAFLVTKLLCFHWISSKKECSLSIPGKYFLLNKDTNLVATDKSRCYDDCLLFCGMTIYVTYQIYIYFFIKLRNLFIVCWYDGVMLGMPVTLPAMENSLGLAVVLSVSSLFYGY